MGAQFTAEEIMDIVEARLAVGMMHEDLGEICTDTRLIKEGDWFLALRGEEFDGHDFIGEAYSSGAIGCIVEERTNYAIASTSFPLLAVPDTSDALGMLARNWRKRLNPRVAFIPTDDGLEALIERINDEFTKRFPGSYLFAETVDRIEIFEKFLSMPDDTKAVVIQYHIDTFEEVEKVGNTALPSVVMLTEESVESFRLSLTDKELAAIPFGIMPTLKLNYGMLIVTTDFSKQLLADVDDNFLRNILLFDTEGDAPTGQYLKPAGTQDEKVAPLLKKARAYSRKEADSDGDLAVLELTAMIMLMMGVELDSVTTQS